MKKQATAAGMFLLSLLFVGCISSTSDCEKTETAAVSQSAEGSGGSGGNGGSGGSGGSRGTESDCGFESQCDPSAGPLANKAVCDDDIPKTLDRCVPVPEDGSCGGVCAHVGAQCDSLDPMSVKEMSCDDDNECTEDRCGQENNCEYSKLSGSPCENGNCIDGVCVTP
jgi:hypothetical protein